MLEKKGAERTLSLIKNDISGDSVLVAEVIMTYIDGGARMLAMKQFVMTEEIFDLFYGEHKGRDYYEPMKKRYVGGLFFAFIWQGTGVIQFIREKNGKTDPAKAAPGTIRNRYGSRDPAKVHENCVHSSDSPEGFRREVDIIF